HGKESAEYSWRPPFNLGQRQYQRWQLRREMLDAATHQASIRLDPILVARVEIQLRHTNVLINAQQPVILAHEIDGLYLAASVTGMLGQSSAVLGRVVHQAGDFMAIGNSMQTGHEGVIRRQRSNN